MTVYQYSCDKCKIYWELDFPLGQAPKKTLCLKYKKKRERFYSSSPQLIFKGMDFHTNRRKSQKFHQHGASKDDALRYYNESIKATNARLNEITSPYSKMAFTNKVAKNRGARKLSEREVRDKIALAKKLTQQTNMIHSYNKRRAK